MYLVNKEYILPVLDGEFAINVMTRIKYDMVPYFMKVKTLSENM